ncbi:MAG: adenylosuccinate lyase [Candidatus Aenigmarchaeota archaeon]|nr:adenylosuccinate lyase [Candidatus Aenigmarchaeota archaeon]
MAIHPIEYRYFTEEMKKVWEEEAKLQGWLTVEAALAKANAKFGIIPANVAEEISKKANTKFVKLEKVKMIEEEIQHDLMAMVKVLTEVCNGDAGKYVHVGATSYDIEDTAYALQFRDAIKIIEKKLAELKNVLLKLAEWHKKTICIGRTHGQHAAPTTYGMKFALYAAEIQRHLDRLEESKKRVLVGKMTGAVGTQASFGKKGIELQKFVMKELGLEPVLVSTQVIQRDRYAEVINDMALIASTLEKIAKEIRNLQRTEIAEVFEPFKEKQVGSSTMPHKRNPHKSERICGLARVVRSNVMPILENIPLEHERDLTDSSVERIIFPETFILVDYMLKEMINILSGLEFNYDNIKKNLNMTNGLIMTENLMLGLVKKGIGRQDAHELLRQASMKVIKENKSLKEVLLKNETIKKKFTGKELDWYLDPKNYIGTAVEQVENVIKTLRVKS